MTRTHTLAFLLLVSAGSIVAGVYLWLGWAGALILGGALGAATALLVDDGRKAAAGNG